MTPLKNCTFKFVQKPILERKDAICIQNTANVFMAMGYEICGSNLLQEVAKKRVLIHCLLPQRSHQSHLLSSGRCQHQLLHLKDTTLSQCCCSHRAPGRILALWGETMGLKGTFEETSGTGSLQSGRRKREARLHITGWIVNSSDIGVNYTAWCEAVRKISCEGPVNLIHLMNRSIEKPTSIFWFRARGTWKCFAFLCQAVAKQRNHDSVSIEADTVIQYLTTLPAPLTDWLPKDMASCSAKLQETDGLWPALGRLW